MSTLSGSVIGAILGFISSFGYIAMNSKEKQRSDLFPLIAAITTTFGAISGGRIGYKTERSDLINKSLGFDKIKHSHYKVGRFWEAQSTWFDIKGGRHIVTTLKRNNYIVSLYNGAVICTHGTSASSVNITRNHNEARNIVFAKIKERIGDAYLSSLTDT